MPASEASIIVGGDRDGIRDGKRLARLYPNSALYVDFRNLNGVLRSYRRTPLFLILVSHIRTGHDHVRQLLQMDSNGLPSILVLAMCSSGTETFPSGWTLAQKLAIQHRRRVDATTRFLAFTEVGNGTAFAKSGVADFILPSNNPSLGTQDLWLSADPRRASGLEEVSVGIDNLTI